MKKTILALILILALCLSGCGAADSNTDAASGEGDTSADDTVKNDDSASSDSAKSDKDGEEKKATAADNDVKADDDEKDKQDTEKKDEEKKDDEAQDKNDGAEKDENAGKPEKSEPADTTEPTPAPEPEPQAPYSVKTSDTVLTVTGSGTDRDYYFTLSDLKNVGGTVSADYFSKGKEPAEATNSFTGISVDYLLNSVVGSNVKKATFTSADGYAVSYSASNISATYINEKDPSASLKMILAWSEDGASVGLRLVMGQSVEGEYNRTFWARDIVTIEVKAG